MVQQGILDHLDAESTATKIDNVREVGEEIVNLAPMIDNARRRLADELAGGTYTPEQQEQMRRAFARMGDAIQALSEASEIVNSMGRQ